MRPMLISLHKLKKNVRQQCKKHCVNRISDGTSWWARECEDKEMIVDALCNKIALNLPRATVTIAVLPS